MEKPETCTHIQSSHFGHSLVYDTAGFGGVGINTAKAGHLRRRFSTTDLGVDQG